MLFCALKFALTRTAYHRLKIDPEVEEIPSSSSHLTVRVEPETEYTISLIVVISKARDIQTSEITRIIKMNFIFKTCFE